MIVPQVKLVNNPSVDERLLSDGGLVVSGFKPVEPSSSAAAEDKAGRQQILSLKVPSSFDDLGE